MNDFLENLPSLGNMVKLIVFLILALIALALVIAIIKALIPVLVLAALVLGGYYLFTRWQDSKQAA